VPNPTQDQSPYLPATVTITFVSVWNDDGPIPLPSLMPQPYQIVVPIATVIGAAVAGTGASTSLAGVTSTSHLIHDTALALFSSTGVTGTPDNNTNLTALANQIAQDYYAWRVLGWDRVVAGIVSHAQDGFTDVVELSYREESPGYPNTRARAYIGNDDCEEMNHSDAPGWMPTAQVYHVITTTAIAAATSANQMTSGTATVRTASFTGLLTTDTSSPLHSMKIWNKDTSSTGAIPIGTNLMVIRDSNSKYVVFWRQC
jgi:hypothetical protein